MEGGKGETFKGKYLAIKASNYANAQEFFGYKCVNWCARAIFFAKVSNCVRLLLKLVPAAAAAFVIKKSMTTYVRLKPFSVHTTDWSSTVQ